ncbi:MBL fold metallo-hydrolase [Candidatus Omnitrophota bacterium]
MESNRDRNNGDRNNRNRIERFVVGFLGTNCYLIYGETSKSGFLIDPGLFDKRIKAAIEKNGIRVKSVVNTHGHADHTAGDRKAGYPVLIHEADKDFVNDLKDNLSFLKDGDIIKEDGVELKVIHTPGHTPGGICLKVGDVLFTGDTLFRDGVGRTDFPYGDEADLMRSIRTRLMTFPDETRVLPGHGPESTIGHEKKNNPFFQ